MKYLQEKTLCKYPPITTDQTMGHIQCKVYGVAVKYIQKVSKNGGLHRFKQRISNIRKIKLAKKGWQILRVYKPIQ